MQKRLLLVCLTLVSWVGYAQIVQNVRGLVVDGETNAPLIGVQVRVVTSDTTKLLGAATNLDGEFTISNVPIGKHSLEAHYVGYDTYFSTVEVTSGKEVVLQVKMMQRFVQGKEVVVTNRKDGETINEMAAVSAQQFSVEETGRYAGSRRDPARMVSNYAGVQGTDDSRNDIVVRGNSPLGILWRVEGIDIPNPSHFAVSGSTGGPVSMINNKVLANSDFFMSAFPAQYGNSTSGVFDLRLRNGNNERHEFTGQFGLLGTQVMMEGPFSSKSKASYLFAGNYSTLSMFKAIGISIGTDAVPSYADLSFKLNFPLKHGGTLSWWGIGGASAIDIKVSQQKKYSAELYGEGDRDQHFATAMAVSALTYKKPLNDKTYIQASLGGSFEQQESHHEYVVRHLDTTMVNGSPDVNIKVDSIYPLMGYRFQTYRGIGQFSLTHKINTRHLITAGTNIELPFFNMRDSVLDVTQSYFVNRWNTKTSGLLAQVYFQWKYRITEKMNLMLGVHSQYYTLSNSWSYAEPRLGWDWYLKKGQKLKFGVGLHSQTQPSYLYTYHEKAPDGSYVEPNRHMGFTRSLHIAGGYQKSFNGKLRINTEIYYQYLFDIPIETHPSAFSLINKGSGFQRFFPDTLVNKGIGRNYGIELTVEKSFDKTYYILFSAMLYNSQYQGSDKVWRNTDYNSNFGLNLLGGKDFRINAKNTISIGLKVTYAGGKRYGYVNVPASSVQRELVYLDSGYNTRQFRNYFRIDFKLNYKLNTKKFTHEIGISLLNVLNTKNLLALAYSPNLANPSAEPIAAKNQLGFLPLFYYRIDFRLQHKNKESKESK